MTPYKTNEANILYSVRQNNISNNNFQIADTFTHCAPSFWFVEATSNGAISKMIILIGFICEGNWDVHQLQHDSEKISPTKTKNSRTKMKWMQTTLNEFYLV